jgi:autotransporter-associated beta strand protein
MILSGNISGSTSLTHDSGALTLSGTNTYNGGTIINSGAAMTVSGASGLLSTGSVQVDGSLTTGASLTIGDLTGSGTINPGNGNTLTVGTSNSTTFAGVISNTNASFAKTGSGTLTLTGDNSYGGLATGSTFIVEGTLALSGAGQLNTTLIIMDPGTTFDISEITGLGGLVTGSINGGAGGFVNIGDLSLVVLTAFTDSVFDGVIQGSNNSVVSYSTSNGRSVTLTEAQTCTGSFGAASSSGSSSFILSGNGSIASYRQVNLFDSAILDISQTTIGATLNNLNSPSNCSLVLGSKTATLNSTLNTACASPISGSGGSVIKTGSATLSLTGTNTYTGPTQVNAGTLQIGGTHASSTTINNGGTLSVTNTGVLTGTTTVGSGGILKGTGTVNTAIVQAGGILSPGSSIGTITVPSLSLDSSSITRIEIDPSSSSSILSTTANLGGQVQVIQDAGSYPSSFQYTILTADTINGTFDPTVTGGSAGSYFSLSYDATHVFLNLSDIPPPPPPSPVTPINTNDLPHGGGLNYADYLNNTVPNSRGTQLLAQLSGSQLQDALNSVSPARNAFATFATQTLQFTVSQAISSHLVDQRFFHTRRGGSSQDASVAALFAENDAMDSDDLFAMSCNRKKKASSVCEPMERTFIPDPCDRYSFWAEGLGEYSHLKAFDQNPAFNAYTGAGLLGFDFYGLDHNLFGVAVGYAYTHLVEKSNGGQEKINTVFANLFHTLYYPKGYLEFGVWSAYNRIQNQRYISFPGFDAIAHASFNSWQLVPHFGCGYHAAYNWGAVEPFFQLDCAVNWQDSFNEYGAGPFNNFQDSQTSELLRTEAGLRFYQTGVRDWGTWMVLEKVSYVYMKTFGTGLVSAAIAGSPSFFTIETMRGAQNLGSAGIEFLWRNGKKKPVTVSFSYDGEWGGKYMSNEILLKFAKDF